MLYSPFHTISLRMFLSIDCFVFIYRLDLHQVAGGEAGQNVAPVEVAGCYAPGGRYPLPSSVLMGVVTARYMTCSRCCS